MKVRKSFSLVEDVARPVYGPSQSIPFGALAIPGKGDYGHVFGGSKWSVSNWTGVPPTLILTWDCADPLFRSVDHKTAPAVPCFASIQYLAGLNLQVYRIDYSNSTVEFIERTPIGDAIDFPFDFPLLPQSIQLAPMESSDYPISESQYWKITDQFVGGRNFIRVGGPPIWLDAPASVQCACGREMTYICSLGYEIDLPWSGLIPGHPVFFGEMAIYWMMCDLCHVVAVFSQST